MNNEQIQLLHKAFVDHEEKDNTRFEEMKQDLKEIKELLKPIAETYTSASNSIKWLMAFLVGISIILGIVWEVIQIVFKLKQ